MILPPPFVPPASILKGVGASPGVVIGKAHVIGRQKRRPPHYRLESSITAEMELVRLNEAFRRARKHMEKAKNSLPPELSAQEPVFEAHLMLLQDKLIRNQSENFVTNELINAEWALEKTLDTARLMFGAIKDDYIRSRLDDIELVIDGLIMELMGEQLKAAFNFAPNTVIVAHDFSPAALTQIALDKTMGLVTETGSRTSHTSIVAQALELPAVVGASGCLRALNSGDMVIIDGSTGHLLIRPDENTLKFYTARQQTLSHFQIEIVRCAHLPAETLDEHTVAVLGNLELVEEVATLVDHGGEGIGLYRTEFLYMTKKGLPTEEELFENYRLVVSTINPNPVTIRTLDAGGDKVISGINKEPNPALGLRAIRFCLKYRALFRTQLRAILRASVYGQVKLMAPMITSFDEWWEFRALVEETKAELKKEGLAFKNQMPLGIMIEVPAAVILADQLAQEVDFFSIGTNDLIQYTLAIDRVNPEVADLYQPFHPAVLRQIKQVVAAAREAKIPLSVCGDMAAGLPTAAVLVGLGVNSLSMPAAAIPQIKRLIRMAAIEQLAGWAEDALKQKTALETQFMMTEVLSESFPDLFQ